MGIRAGTLLSKKRRTESNEVAKGDPLRISDDALKGHIYILRYGFIIQILIGFIILMLEPSGYSLAMGEVVKIAHWHNDFDAAVSLRFDDTLESHVYFVVPTLNRYGFKATFMVNPGRSNYIRHRGFWEKEVVSAGHRLGNHTMHHIGAKTIEEAEYEIGEAVRILGSVPTGESNLMVFAAGGLTKWGGTDWEKSENSYKRLVGKNSLVDLYDGFHFSENFHSTETSRNLCDRLQNAINQKSHQTFVFHDVGRPSVKDFAKKLIFGYHLTIGEDDFKNFMECLNRWQEQTWIAPLIHIYKYEAEREGSSITVLENKKNLVRLKLNVRTDPSIYDHNLTIIYQFSGKNILSILQDGVQVYKYKIVNKALLIQIEPKPSEIIVYKY